MVELSGDGCLEKSILFTLQRKLVKGNTTQSTGDIEQRKIVALKKIKFNYLEAGNIRFMAREINILRNITQAMKLGALGAPAYQAFSLKDIEDATNNFDTSTFVLEGSYSQVRVMLSVI
ncbi:hypothetical protein DCAR_0101136 [Daucus carota subsp. sativus]|uniref:Uncharacterized protein n=1 Tax=Daucus carota subsp. sativus TaxID=79200 RepID=A0A166G5Z4_DAUCS|nr:hypothetical protein DCAR_0101136 [Daucus carota subsp. sativus]